MIKRLTAIFILLPFTAFAQSDKEIRQRAEWALERFDNIQEELDATETHLLQVIEALDARIEPVTDPEPDQPTTEPEPEPEPTPDPEPEPDPIPVPEGVGVQGEWPFEAVACHPSDAQFGPGEQFDPSGDSPLNTLKRAVNHAISNDGDGVATVVLTPGEYLEDPDDPGSFWKQEWGQNVELCGGGGIARFAFPDIDFLTEQIVFSKFGDLSFKNLDFYRIWPKVAWADDLTFQNTRISTTSSECIFLNPDATKSIVRTINSEFIGCKSQARNRGDTVPSYYGHSMYVNRRSCVWYSVNSVFKAAGTLEIWRSMCRVNVLTNNYFSNTPVFPNIPSDFPPHGRSAGVLDLMACGTHVLRNNVFEAADNSNAILLRQRRSIGGCDIPPQRDGDQRDSQAGDGIVDELHEDYWRLANVGVRMDETSGYWANPRTFPTILENNVIRGTGGAAINHYTTYPIKKVTGSQDRWLKASDNWFERSFIIAVGNSFEGWDRLHHQNRLDGVHDSTLPGVMEIRDALPQPQMFQLDTPPVDWIPDEPVAICKYLSQRLIWPEGESPTGRRYGFPSC